jgi:hypothetical protein
MTAWSPEFCNALVAHGHYVIRFDNRDVGLSTKFEGAKVPGRLHYVLNHLLSAPLNAPYTLADMASDAAGVLEGGRTRSARHRGSARRRGIDGRHDRAAADGWASTSCEVADVADVEQRQSALAATT